ncbi:MarR family transcriptional regulator, partial [Bacillus sp. S34]|nr:MarR family transcriptional regulator [Bacillus sp. S34]
TRMVARGLVERADCPTDGRGSWVEMTPNGRRAVLAGIRAHTGALEDLFWRPVGTDAETLRSVSARVQDAIGPDEPEADAAG